MTRSFPLGMPGRGFPHEIPVKSPEGSAFVYLLDSVTAATAAYSMRKLRSAYTGFCVNLRRSSDNATADFGFGPDGWVDLAAIASWAGASTLFLATWYDQTGNSYDATQGTTSLQGTFLTSYAPHSNRPAIQFTATAGRVSAGAAGLLAALSGAATYSISVVASTTDVTVGNKSALTTVSAGTASNVGITSSTVYGPVTTRSAAAVNSTRYAVMATQAANDQRLYVNGALSSNGAVSRTLGTVTAWVPMNNSTSSASVHVSESILWTADLQASAVAIQTNQVGTY